MNRPGKVGGLVLVLVIAWGGTAEAMWAATGGGQASSKALALQAPSGLISNHPNVTGSNAGDVALSWMPSASSFSTGTEVQRAPGSCTGFVAIATVTGSTYTDATAAYDQQYCYRVAAVASGWRTPGPSTPAFSLPPTTATDTTGAALYTLAAADLSGLAAADGVLYTTQAKWSRGAAGQYVELAFSPASITAPPASTKVTLVYQAGAKPPAGTTMTLLVSADGGATWTAFALPVPAAKNVDVTATTDVHSVVATAAALAGMRLRFEVGVPSGGGFQTSYDLAHVDVD